MESTLRGVQPGIVASTDIALTTTGTEARLDTRMLAPSLGNKHKSLFELVNNYKADFAELGILRFQTAVIQGRGQPEKFAMLNEDQCYLLLAYSKNTERVRQLKLKLVKAFREARKAADLRLTEYLPAYHALHDQIKFLAAGSPHERFIHINLNKATNKAAGLEPGQRARASLPQQSMLIVAQSVAVQAAQGATDHHELQRRVKKSLQALTAVTMLGVQ